MVKHKLNIGMDNHALHPTCRNLHPITCAILSSTQTRTRPCVHYLLQDRHLIAYMSHRSLMQMRLIYFR